MLPCRVEQVPGDGLGEVAVGMLDQQATLEVENVATEGELIPISGFPEQVGRLADQIEREVGETDVDLEHRPMSAPFAQALPEHQRIVSEAQEVVGARIDSDG